MEDNEEKACLCALNRIFGFDPKTGLALISHFGSAREIFHRHEDELEEIFGPYSRHKGKISCKAADDAAEELSMLSRKGISFQGITEKYYPPLLKECEDAPIGLYIKSITPACELWRKPSVSIVGTRDISPYGREWCRRIVDGLAETESRPAIVSGLAIGVDIEAHKGAIENGLPTIAVMATGPETVYPYRHRAFAEGLSQTPGCALVTDYPPGTAPLAVHFLRRNRIIAGLSEASVLVESKAKGGGMMTCRLAFSYNRDVYALPGRADDIRSQGCNELIRKKIAEPLTSVSSFIESLGMDRVAGRKILGDKERLMLRYTNHMSSDSIMMMEGILRTIRKARGITIEELARTLGLPYGKTTELTGILEIDGFIIIDILQRCSINPKNM